MTGSFEPGSYRDRRARVLRRDGAVFRVLRQDAFEAWRTLSRTQFFRDFSKAGRLVATWEVPADGDLAPDLPEDWVAVLRHETIPFVSYCYEWPFGMLRDAALLQLDLVRAAIAEGMTLRDASPFNIQWEGTRSVFIDISSFDRLAPGEPWIGYRQFCRLFLYPLFLQAYKHVPFQPWLRGHHEGIEAAHLCRMMGLRDYLRPGVFVHLYLHAKAESRYGRTQRHVRAELRNAGFSPQLIQANVRRLERLVRRLSITDETSHWLAYEEGHSYDEGDRQRKVEFVRSVLRSRAWNLVWDLGCNRGTFSRIAAEQARYVVAFDADHLVVEDFYQQLKSEANTRILPLVVDLVNPSPSLGWRGSERKSLWERGVPDLILCLALIHHVVIGANVPVPELLDWLASFGSDVLIEFVGRQDPMVQGLLRNREDDYADYDEACFEQFLTRSFEVARREKLAAPRTLYYARAKAPRGVRQGAFAFSALPAKS